MRLDGHLLQPFLGLGWLVKRHPSHDPGYLGVSAGDPEHGVVFLVAVGGLDKHGGVNPSSALRWGARSSKPNLRSSSGKAGASHG